MKLVIYPSVETERLEALRAAAPGASWVNAPTVERAAEAMPGAHAFLGKITPELLARADRLQWVQAFTASLEHYVFPELIAHSCVLTNTRGLFGDVIADQVMGYVLCFARNLHTYIRRQIEHRYEPVGGEAARVNNASGPGTVNAMDRATIFLPRSTMGIIGMGAIGREIARRAGSFGMTVRGVDRFPGRFELPGLVERVDGLDQLPTLLAWSEFAVIAAPHTPETAGLFNARTLNWLRHSSYLINIGRGAIVVLDDLAAALRDGKLAGAALDVFEVEPLPADHPLWDAPGMLITPHVAAAGPYLDDRRTEVFLDNCRRFRDGRPLRNVVDKGNWF
jgi:phosphoglycerate dehydrogenase-like enzyme